MGYIAEDVERAAGEAGLPLRALGEAEAGRVRAALEDRYAGGVRRWPLWEHARLPVGVHDASAWRWLGEFVGAAPCLLLFNPRDDQAVFELRSGDDLELLLGETIGYEFYVTDQAASYLLCFNHHDVLIAGGVAEAWLRARG